MEIGVPRETHRHENRVGLNPFAVARLTRHGHSVFIESRAGETARFSDQDYQSSGGHIVYTTDEVYKRAELVCRVNGVEPEEVQFLHPGLLICGFQHLAISSREHVEKLMALDVSLIGYEIIRDSYGELPVLTPFSEMGGQLAVQLAAALLQNDRGGRGILLGNVPGVPPPTVLILGGGSAGSSAALQAHVSGAHVIVLDSDPRKLREIHHEFAGQIVTAMAGSGRLEQYTQIADVIIGTVLIPGARAPHIITADMVAGMKPGSVIIDMSIDQGGCVETSRPTTLDDPTFEVNNVVHYCVSNMTSNIARTASRALSSAALPYLGEIASRGLDDALRNDPGLTEGVYLYKGKLTSRAAAEALGIPKSSLEALLEGNESR